MSDASKLMAKTAEQQSTAENSSGHSAGRLAGRYVALALYWLFIFILVGLCMGLARAMGIALGAIPTAILFFVFVGGGIALQKRLFKPRVDAPTEDIEAEELSTPQDPNEGARRMTGNQALWWRLPKVTRGGVLLSGAWFVIWSVYVLVEEPYGGVINGEEFLLFLAAGVGPGIFGTLFVHMFWKLVISDPKP